MQSTQPIRWRMLINRLSIQRLLCATVACTTLLAGVSNAQQNEHQPAFADNVATLLTADQPALEGGQTATQLADGRWLLVGGSRTPASLKILNHGASNASTLPAALLQPRSDHTATLLPDGRVLIFGGTDRLGMVLDTAEAFDPITGALFTLGSIGLLPRAKHSATVLSDGRVLVAGGIGADRLPLGDADLFDPHSATTERIDLKQDIARIQQIAALLPDRSVLLWGGRDAAGIPRSDGDVYDPNTRKVGSVTADRAERLAQSLAADKAPSVLESLPSAHATRVPVGQRISVLFSQRMAAASLNANSVTLIGPSGVSPINPVVVERGVLLFVTPVQELIPGAGYTLFIKGAEDLQGQLLPFTAIGFTTAAMTTTESEPIGTLAATGQGSSSKGRAGSGDLGLGPVTIPPNGLRDVRSVIASVLDAYGLTFGGVDATIIPFDDSDLWLPGAEDRRGNWISGWQRLAIRTPPTNAVLRHVLLGDPDVVAAITTLTPLGAASPAFRKMKSKISMRTPTGVTTVTGQVLRLNGRPLSNVTLSIGGIQARTDLNGEFLLPGAPSGHRVLVIDGSSANVGSHEFGRYEYGMQVKAGESNPLPFVIWMSRLDSSYAIDLASPTTSPVVLTNPRIPGLELRIPAGTVIRDAKGKIVTHISMTAIPTDQPPFPLPNLPVPTYFTVQPGGAHLEGSNGQPSSGAQLVYPNFTHSSPGTRMTFWDYDSRVKGWYAYGEGTVTAEGTQIMPDPGVLVYEFSGAMVSLPSNAPPEGPVSNGCTSGDPVDCFTGLFINDGVDLAIPDVIPLEVRRSYRNRDPASRAFGIGTNLSYDFFLVGDTSPYTYQDLILADGSRVHYPRISAGTSFADAVYRNTSTPGRYFGSTIVFNSGWLLTLKDGTQFSFGDRGGSANARAAAVLNIKDRNGNQLILTRDNFGNLTQALSTNGRKLIFTYDASNRITQVTDELNRIVQYAYDTLGRLITVTDPALKTEQFTYDSNHNMLTVTDKRNSIKVTNTYDSNNRVKTQKYADNSTSSFVYTLNGAGTAVVQTDFTDQRSVVRRMVFGANGYPSAITRAFGLSEQQITTFSRDTSTALLNSVTDALNRTTNYAYDALGNTTNVTRSGASVSFSYEPSHNQIQSFTDANNVVTQISFDASGNPIQATDALNHSTQVGFDEQGRPTTVTDALGHVLTLGYFGADLANVTDALSRSSFRLTDAVGRTTSTLDPMRNTTGYVYDALSRVTTQTDPNGATIQFSYDENGNILTQTDPNNNVTTYTYDTLNRPLTKKDALTRIESYTYDLIGNLATKTDRKGQVTRYVYDGHNRLTAIKYNETTETYITQQGLIPGSPLPPPLGPTYGTRPIYDGTITYTLDSGNRVTQIVDSVNGTIGRGYDTLDRLSQETTPQGAVNYTYDAGGRRTSMTASGQTAVSYGYDAANRLTQIQQASGAINGNQAQTVTIAYDNVNRRSLLTLPNGVKASYTYDNANQLTGISYAKSDNTVIGDLSYSYDAAGRRNAMGGSLANADLPAATTGTASYNANNQLTSWSGVPFSYDLNGSLLNDGSRSYVWNSRNELSSISGSSTASFQYDAFGRRQQKTASSATTSYLYDGNNFVQKKTGSTTLNQLTGGIDELFAQYPGAGVTVPLTDALGSSLGETNGSQQVTANYSYEPYGATSRTGTDNSGSQQYTGRENDLTGLYYYRARYYSPGTGRFVSEDPLGWGGGQPNVYAYVGGNPISFIDPLGLFDIFGFGSVAVETPGPVRMGFEGIALAGYNSNSGGYVGDILAKGYELGSQSNYVAEFNGCEYTSDNRGGVPINIREVNFGAEIPFLAGLGIGGGRYKTDNEQGYFVYFHGGFIGDHGSLGFGGHF